MRIFGPFVVGMLFIGMFAMTEFTAPVDAWALDVLRMDTFLWISTIQDPKELPITLANPWTDRRVQRYLKSAKERFRPAGPLARDSFFAWEEADFFGVAGQGRATSRSKTNERDRMACRSTCCLY